LANPYLNGFISHRVPDRRRVVFRQVWQLIKSVGWIEAFAKENSALM
jgi:hypothetical protein